MSRLFVKRLYLTPLLAAKQSPRCRFPTRSFNSAANVYNSTAPGTAQSDQVSGNANPRRLWNPQNEDHLISRVYKLEDRAHSSDDRFITSVKDSAALKVDVTKAIGDIGSKMEATMAKLQVEFKSDMAKLQVELKSDMAKLSTETAKMYGELKSEIGDVKSKIADVKSELKSDIVDIKSKVGKIEDGIKSLSWQVKAIYGAALAVVGYFATKYPDEFLSFAKGMLARISPPQSNPS